MAIFGVVMLADSVNGVVVGGLIGSPRRFSTPLELWSWRAFLVFFGLLALGIAVAHWRELRTRHGSL